MTISPMHTEANMPKNLDEYRGRFVVFFTDDQEPEVRFSTEIGSEAYSFAHELEKETGRSPVVYRVAINLNETLFQLLSTRA